LGSCHAQYYLLNAHFFLEIYGVIIQKIRILSHYHVANLC